MNSLRIAVLGLLLGLTAGPTWAAGQSAASLGRSIYLRGVLSSGAPLEAVRGGGRLRTKGTDAACVNCHQRSGLGSLEGRVSIPPITGRFLFHPRADTTDKRDLPYVSGMRANREPYTEATFARALREGVDVQGRSLSYLMPRYALSDAEMVALIDYLRSLDPAQVPGVTDTVLHFATIITPDADPVKRRGMLDVMQQYFADRNAHQFGPSARLHASGKTMYADTMFMVNRRWQLHVWELNGPAATWEAQLKERMAEQPVLAVISGLGGANWAPVHAFCEHARVPCLFPNVEVPVEAPGGFYSMYLCSGVLLEADLIARRILEPVSGQTEQTIHQIYRSGDSGEAAARALAAALAGKGVTVHDHRLPANAHGEDMAEAVHAASGAQTLILWLRSADIASLDHLPAPAANVLMSGLMAGLEHAPLPSAWRGHTRMTYPFDLPDRRVVRVDTQLKWFSIRHVPVVAEQVQTDTYLACGLVAENLSHMVDTFIPEYMIERMQQMLEHRLFATGYYPHLTLATNQHFASKGGYLVYFAEPSGSRLIADSDWLVP